MAALSPLPMSVAVPRVARPVGAQSLSVYFLEGRSCPDLTGEPGRSCLMSAGACLLPEGAQVVLVLELAQLQRSLVTARPSRRPLMSAAVQTFEAPDKDWLACDLRH
jgi:hypothetical protein